MTQDETIRSALLAALDDIYRRDTPEPLPANPDYLIPVRDPALFKNPRLPKQYLHTPHTPHVRLGDLTSAGITDTLFISLLGAHGFRELADEAERQAAEPDYVAQFARQARGGSIYMATGLAPGNWTWMAFGPFTPPASTVWAAAGVDYVAGDLVKVTGSDTVWEAAVDHVSAAGNAPGVGAEWVVYLVEDYHWWWERNGSEFHDDRIQIGPAVRSENWAPINDELWKKLPADGGAPGVVALWGAEFVVKGSITFGPGVYNLEKPLKHVPQCQLSGMEPYHREASYLVPHATNWSGGDRLVEGAYRNGSNSNSNFWTSFRRLFVDGRGILDVGIDLRLSHGSVVEDVVVDRVNLCAFHVRSASDNFTVRNVAVDRLLNPGSGTQKYGWWFDNNCNAFHMENVMLTKCEVGISFGLVRGFSINVLEHENAGCLFESREYGHPAMDGTPLAGMGAAGFLGGGTINGIRARRNSADTFVPSTRALARVRVQNARVSLSLQGVVEDAAGNEPYDRIEVQQNTGAFESFPLRVEQGYDNTGIDQFSFDFHLEKMMRNLRLRGDNTKVQATRIVAADNPAQMTDDTGAVQIDLEPGLYRIEILNGTFDGGNLTVRKEPGGAAVEGMNGVSAAVVRLHHHPGGQMEYELAGTTNTGAAAVDLYFRPWLD